MSITNSSQDKLLGCLIFCLCYHSWSILTRNCCWEWKILLLLRINNSMSVPFRESDLVYFVGVMGWNWAYSKMALFGGARFSNWIRPFISVLDKVAISVFPHWMSAFPTYSIFHNHKSCERKGMQRKNGLLNVKLKQLFLFIHSLHTYWVATMCQALF